MVAAYKAAGDFAIVTGTSLSIPIPAVDAGDYGVMWLYQAYSEALPSVPGWSLVHSELDGNGGVGLLLYRVMTEDAAATTLPITVAPNGSAAKVVTFSSAGTAAPAVATITHTAEALISPPLTITEPTGMVFFAFIYAARTAGAVSTSGTISATATARAWDDALGAYTHSTVTAEVTSADGGTINRAFTGGLANTWEWAVLIPAAAPAPAAPTIASLDTIHAGAPLSQNLLASGDPATFGVTAGTLPAGLTLSTAGVLTGAASFAWAPYDFTITATNAGGSDSVRFQGSIRLPGETARTTGTTGATAWTRFAATVSGDAVVLYVPTGSTPSAVVSMMHGAGSDESWPDYEPAESRDFALDQGWAVMGANAGGNSYASDTALDAWDAAHAWLDALWSIADVILYAGSMGSQLALIYAAQQRMPNIRGLVLVDSVMNLDWYWSNAPSEWRQAIKDAYGFTDDADYATATAGTDPMLLPTSTWDGMTMWVSWSPNDGTILPAQNTQLFLPRATGADVDVHQGTGVHSAPENFAPEVVNPWMAGLFAEQVDATLSGAGALSATVDAALEVDVAAPLAGAGALAATVDAAIEVEVTATLSGGGSLSAAVSASAAAEVAADLAGAGALSAAIEAALEVAVALAGTGALSAAVEASTDSPAIVATLAGSGALEAGIQPITHLAAALSAAGHLSVTVRIGERGAIYLGDVPMTLRLGDVAISLA